MQLTTFATVKINFIHKVPISWPSLLSFVARGNSAEEGKVPGLITTICSVGRSSTIVQQYPIFATATTYSAKANILKATTKFVQNSFINVYTNAHESCYLQSFNTNSCAKIPSCMQLRLHQISRLIWTVMELSCCYEFELSILIYTLNILRPI